MPAETKTFPEEAIPNWRAYVERMPNYQRRYEWKSEDFLTHQVRLRGKGYIKASGTWAMGEGGREESNRWEAWGINSAYSFRIHRENDQDWHIEDLYWVAPRGDETVYGRVCLPTNDGFPCRRRDQWSLAMRSLCKGLMLNSLWLPEMIESEDFVLQSVTSLERENGSLVRVDFDYDPPNASHPVRGGFVLLDPSRYWLIREARTLGSWPDCESGEILFLNEFDTTLDSIPLLSRHEMHWIGTLKTGENLHRVTEFRNDSWQRTRPDEEEYKLSAFGIPEPGT